MMLIIKSGVICTYLNIKLQKYHFKNQICMDIISEPEWEARF